MSLKSLGAELRRTREEQNISLGDIAAATRINQKFLEAIEEGNLEILPQTYVRAFLREYAQCVNLSPDAVLARYDEARGVKGVERQAAAPEAGRVSGATPMPGRAMRENIRRHAGMIVVGLAALVFVIYMLNTSKDAPAPPISEVPFDKVVRESEATLVKPETIVSAIAPVKPEEPDSLRLEMTTSDSVWISIVIDGKKTEEYLFPPKRTKSWAARERFQITMGNAGGALFRLNGEELPPLGRRGAVVRNVVISEESLNKKL